MEAQLLGTRHDAATVCELRSKRFPEAELARDSEYGFPEAEDCTPLRDDGRQQDEEQPGTSTRSPPQGET